MEKTIAFLDTSIISLSVALDYLHSASTAGTVEEANSQIAGAVSLLAQLLRLADEANSELMRA